MPIDAHANPPGDEIFDGNGTGKITQRQVIVKLDEQFRIRLAEKILPRNFACPNGVERNRCLVARTNQQPRSAPDVPLPYEQVEIAVDRKSTRLNSSHEWISYAVFCL